MESVILVDKADNQIGTAEKITAHRLGKLHRCVSVVISNSKGEILLQKRAKGKYHSGGLWSNTCCGHPRPGEEVKSAAQRKLKEEMGLTCGLTKIDTYIYKASLDHGMTEYELGHVFFGLTDHNPILNTEEADGYQWSSVAAIDVDIHEHPESYTYWFKLIFPTLIRDRITNTFK